MQIDEFLQNSRQLGREMPDGAFRTFSHRKPRNQPPEFQDLFKCFLDNIQKLLSEAKYPECFEMVQTSTRPPSPQSSATRSFTSTRQKTG